MIAHASAQPHLKKKLTTDDFMPHYRRQIQQMDADEVEKAILQAWGGGP